MMTKIAFITGAGGYIGGQIALDLAKEGVKVSICDIDRTTLEKKAEEIKNAGGDVLCIEADITNPESVNKAIQKTVEHFGRLDISVHVAGGSSRIAGPKAKFCYLVDQEDYVIDHVMKVNLYGALYVARAAAAQMIKQGEGGRIISFGSTVGVNGLTRSVEYAAAKGGVMSFTKALAKEVGKYKITVNCVAPGAIARPNNQNTDYHFNTNYLGIKGDASDISNLTCFLASEKARFITGQTYIIDGGRCLAMKGTE